MRHIKVAYIDEESDPESRIFSGWYANFFVRMWQQFLALSVANTHGQKDMLALSMQKNFISKNLATCVELNGHSIISFHNWCRDLGRPDLFIPSQMNSQASEGTFRAIRSLSTTRSTRINADILEFLQRSSRLIIMEDAPSTLGNFMTKTKGPPCFVPTALLSNEQIRAIVRNGFESVGEAFKKFSK